MYKGWGFSLVLGVALVASSTIAEPWTSHRSGTDSEVKLLGALSRRVKLSLDESSITDALAIIGEDQAIPILMDRRAMEEINVDPDSEYVSLRVRDISLRSAMSLMLDQVGLTYAIKNEVLMVTTPDRARDLRFYNIASLERSGVSRDELVTLFSGVWPEVEMRERHHPAGSSTRVTATVSQPAIGGGRRYRIAANGSLLLVRATDREHFQLASSLAAMKRVLGEQETDVATFEGLPEGADPFEAAELDEEDDPFGDL